MKADEKEGDFSNLEEAKRIDETYETKPVEETEVVCINSEDNWVEAKSESQPTKEEEPAADEQAVEEVTNGNDMGNFGDDEPDNHENE